MLVLFLISLRRGFSTWMRLRFVAEPPDSEKSTAPLFKCSCKIYHLKTRQCPRKLFPVTRFVEDGYNFVYKTILLECKQEFSLHPDGFYRPRGQCQNEPIASTKRGTDFIMPLLCCKDVCPTVPDRNSMVTHHFC